MKNILNKLKQNVKNIVEMNPKDLIPYDNNARIHNVDAIADSIQRFGFKEIVCVDENNVIINGHGRVKASIKLGLDKIPVSVCTYLTEEEKKAFRLLDNKVAELTEWDEEKLKSELKSIEDIDMSAFGDAIEEEKERLPKEVQLKSAFEVIVECESEEHQQEIFNNLTEQGLKCRILIL